MIREWEKACTECRRRKSKARQQITAPLPLSRRQTSVRAFIGTAVDLGGLFVTVRGLGRCRKKQYVSLFTYFATSAIHLEITFGLDTNSLSNSFYRMVSCSGLPDEAFSDNMTNFKGADKKHKTIVSQLAEDKIKASGANKEIKFLSPTCTTFRLCT